eukprot:1158520-Pelagomonas_calceolata.AAC.5
MHTSTPTWLSGTPVLCSVVPNPFLPPNAGELLVLVLLLMGALVRWGGGLDRERLSVRVLLLKGVPLLEFVSRAGVGFEGLELGRL